jgi:hypothetical protein
VTARADAGVRRPTDEEIAECARRGMTWPQLLGERAYQEFQESKADADRLERAEQHEVVKVFRAFGLRVYSLSQARASKQTPGLGDLFVILPGRCAFWWETKRPKGGQVSAAQQEFHDLCNAAGAPHHFGGRREAEDLVMTFGLAYRSALGTLEPCTLENL